VIQLVLSEVLRFLWVVLAMISDVLVLVLDVFVVVLGVLVVVLGVLVLVLVGRTGRFSGSSRCFTEVGWGVEGST